MCSLTSFDWVQKNSREDGGQNQEWTAINAWGFNTETFISADWSLCQLHELLND